MSKDFPITSTDSLRTSTEFYGICTDSLMTSTDSLRTLLTSTHSLLTSNECYRLYTDSMMTFADSLLSLYRISTDFLRMYIVCECIISKIQIYSDTRGAICILNRSINLVMSCHVMCILECFVRFLFVL